MFIRTGVTHGKVYSCLMEKCPAIALCDRTVVTDDESGGVSMRRWTNAYTFDRDLFASWCAGGAVWLDDDQDLKGITSTTSTDFNRTSTGVEVFGNELKDSDLENNPINNNNYVCTGDHFNKSQVIQQPDDEGACASACDCDPGIVEVQKSNPAQSPAIGENCPQEAPLPLQQTASTAETYRSVEADQPDPPPGLRPRIDARDNTLLDIPEKIPPAMKSDDE